jgi:Asp-tRNA(Asn)/Glu-tRNA(Gln) amidotransferase A subunit family amidase
VRNYADELARSAHLVSEDFHKERTGPGERATLAEFRAGLRLGNTCRAWIDAAMAEQGWHALLTPSAPGEAPLGLAFTGPATLNYLWTNMGMPAITLPFATGPNGMPIGVQLVARRHEDAALMDVAAWAERVLAG